MVSERKVNPENIEWGDIISTRYGLAKVLEIREIEGVLDYAFLNDVLPSGKPDANGVGKSEFVRKKDYPIRLTSLISKFKCPKQLSLPFVQEMIEKSINERNIQLEKTKQEIISKSMAKSAKSKSVKSKKVLSKEDKLLMELIGKIGVDKLLKELG